MTVKLFIICLPFLLGSLLSGSPEFSIVWSLGGSITIACVAQTSWFRESSVGEPVSSRLLRPGSMFHFMFVAYHVIGGAFHALNGAGYSLFGTSRADPTYDASVISHCQQLMLLAHTSITVGMKLVGFRYDRPKYRFRSIPPYSLILVSMISLGLSIAVTAIPTLGNVGSSLATISATAILVEIWICVRLKRHTNLAVALFILGFNLFGSAVSGWKGLVLFTIISLGALLYQVMPKSVIVGGCGFALFWALFFYPFGLALRPLLWNEGLPQTVAVEMAIDKTIDLSLEERLDIVWQSFSERLNDLTQFRKYVEYVPEVRPYYGFSIIRDAAIALVPRVLWPSKPNLELMSMQRVYEAGVASVGSEVSAKSSFYQDAYLSGGATAVVLACLFLGALMMWLSQTCERLFGGYEIGTCLVYTSLFATVIHMANSFEYFLASMGVSLTLLFTIFFIGHAKGWIVRADEIISNREAQLRTATIPSSRVLVDQ